MKKDIGYIRISRLEHSIVEMNGQMGIFIPFASNPSLYVSRKDSTYNVDVDVEIIPTPNSPYSDKMIKAALPKEAMLTRGLAPDSPEYGRYTPILGNLKSFGYEGRSTDDARSSPKPMPSYRNDLPEALSGKGRWDDL